MNEKLKIWARYYRDIAIVAAINALVHVGYVVTGAGIATATGLVSAKDFSKAGVFWSIVGTVAAAVFGAIYKNPIPSPTPPAVQI